MGEPPEWKKKELQRKRREERMRKRISSKHNLLGELEECPHRDKEMPVRWTEGKDGKLHVEPTRVTVGTTQGFRIDADDWIRIFGTPEEKAELAEREAETD